MAQPAIFLQQLHMNLLRIGGPEAGRSRWRRTTRRRPGHQRLEKLPRIRRVDRDRRVPQVD